MKSILFGLALLSGANLWAQNYPATIIHPGDGPYNVYMTYSNGASQWTSLSCQDNNYQPPPPPPSYFSCAGTYHLTCNGAQPTNLVIVDNGGGSISGVVYGDPISGSCDSRNFSFVRTIVHDGNKTQTFQGAVSLGSDGRPWRLNGAMSSVQAGPGCAIDARR